MNVGLLLRANAVRFPQRDALVEGKRRVSYRELNESTNRLANALLAKNIKKGDKAAVYINSPVEFAQIYFALSKIGVVIVPINYRIKGKEETVIPLLYIKDAVRSLMMIYESPEENLTTRVYNLGQIIPPPTARDVVEAVKRYYPDARIAFKPDPNIVRALMRIPRVMKSDQAEREWGWKIEYSLDDTVKDFIEEFKKMRASAGCD